VFSILIDISCKGIAVLAVVYVGVPVNTSTICNKIPLLLGHAVASNDTF